MRTMLLGVLAAGTLLYFPAFATELPGEPAWDDGVSAARLQLRDPRVTKRDTQHVVFPAIEPTRVEALRAQNAEKGAKFLRIGIERSVGESQAAATRPALEWRPLPGGGQTARIEATSVGAAALRVGLDVVHLPEGAELRFLGNADAGVVAAVTAHEVARMREIQPVYWSPVTEGDTQLIELYLPPGADPRWVRVSTQAVSHLLVSPLGSLAAAKIGESDSCQIDARCMSNPSTAYQNAKRAVARMVFQSGGQSGLCTGTLLNDSDTSTQVPYFFSAAHCFTSQSVASTLATFWFYEATGCGTGVLDTANARQLAGGGTVLFSNVASDVLFLRLNSAAPAGAYFSGWSSATLSAGANILALHHPAGDVQKVSLGQVKGLGPSSLASGNFIQAGYTHGTTEGGSSGCGLLTLSTSGEYLLRGGLLGGSASCSNTGSLSTAANSDDFSRFDQAFPNLQQYLQPTSTPTPTPTPPSGIDYSGAWSNPAQNGWGLIVIRGGSGTYAMYVYHYDQGLFPIWYLSAGPLAGTQFSHSVLQFTGPWFGTTPYNPGAVSNRVVGTLTVNFSTATNATINFTIDGRNVSTTLTKLAF
jgi:lysyl endopeptidase